MRDEWVGDQLAERDTQIDRLQKEVGSLRAKFEDVQNKYRKALALIRQWVQKHPQAASDIDMPHEIEADL